MEKGYKKSKKSKSLAKGYAMPLSEYPLTMTIDEDKLPEIKDWKVGEKYSVEVEVTMTGLHKKYDSDKLCGDFEITSVETDMDKDD
jgi:hypothetical protein